MKKLIVALTLLIGSACFANEVGLKIDKEVNGDWKQAFVVNYETKNLFINSYLDTSVVFVAPRSNFSKPNHEYFEAVFGGRFTVLNGANLDLNTGLRFWWNGNSQGNPEGAEWANGLSLLWKF